MWISLSLAVDKAIKLKNTTRIPIAALKATNMKQLPEFAVQLTKKKKRKDEKKG
jgi:hypothetical protein